MSCDKVPNIITGKDLDYLSDIFNWNYGSYKSAYSMLENIDDESLLEIVDKCANVFYRNMESVLSILEKGENNE